MNVTLKNEPFQETCAEAATEFDRPNLLIVESAKKDIDKDGSRGWTKEVVINNNQENI